MKRLAFLTLLAVSFMACGMSIHVKFPNSTKSKPKTQKVQTQNQTIMVYLLTESQKDMLVGQEYTPGATFNPVQDCNGTWLITQEEIDQLTNEQFSWVRDLTASEYCPPEEQPFKAK